MISPYLSSERRNRKACFGILKIMVSRWSVLLRGIYHIQEYPLRKVMALEKELVPI